MPEQDANTFRHFVENDPEVACLGSDAHTVYSLAQYLELDNYQEIADQHKTDGSDDKSCDYCIIDFEQRIASIVQAYYDASWAKQAAPARKAADLNQAITWLLSMPLPDVPERIRAHATELRQALANGELDEIRLIYVHNCPESVNVAAEMEAARNHVVEAVRPHRSSGIKFIADELGLEKTLELFRGHLETLSITDEVKLSGEFGLIESYDNWRCAQGVISGDVLVELYTKYQGKLFSANVREYLGSRRSSRNINTGIIQTTAAEPGNFYAYNNGVTLLTSSLDLDDNAAVCSGLSIINGAQTTGCLHEAGKESASQVKVLCRVIECNDSAMVEKIVRFNNTQNAVKAADRKSNDPVHKRLSEEFAELGFHYKRRRGIEAAAPAQPVINIDPISQSLASFHGELNLAIRNRSDIFESEAQHRKLFDVRTSARHLLIVEAFSRGLSAHKAALQSKVNRMGIEQKQVDFLDYASGKQFALAVTGKLQEVLCGQRIDDLFDLKLKLEYAKDSFPEVEGATRKLVEILLPLIVTEAGGDYYTVVRSSKRLEEISARLTGTVVAISSSIESALRTYREMLIPLPQA